MSTFAAQIPTGSVNSTNTLFTVTLNTSSLTGFEFYRNGVLLSSSGDYTWSQATGTATITTSAAPPPATPSTLGSGNNNVMTKKLLLLLAVTLPFLAGQTQVDALTQIKNLQTIDVRKGAFTPQIPNQTLSAGSNAINLAPCPLGVNHTDSNHYLYLSGGTGTAEAVLITGGTCTSLAPTGTIIATTLAHSGAWTIASATGGAAEVMQVLLTAGNGGTIAYPDGVTTIHAPLGIPCVASGDLPRYSVHGTSVKSTVISVASDYSLSFTGPFTWVGSGLAGKLSDLTVLFPPGPNSTDISTYTHWPPALDLSINGFYGFVENFDTVNAWISIYAPTNAGSGFVFSKMHISGYQYGMDFSYTANGGYGDFIRISDIYFGPNISGPNTTNNTVAWLHNAVGLYIASGFFGISTWQGFSHQYAELDGGYVEMTNAMMDTAGLRVNGANLNMSGGYCTLADPTVTDNFPYCVQATLGKIAITNQNWQHAVTSTGSYILQDGQSDVVISNLTAQSGAEDVTFLNSTANNSAISLTNIVYTNGGTTAPFIIMNSSDTSLIAQQISLIPTTSGTAKFMTVPGGNTVANINITGNTISNWAIDSAIPVNSLATIVIENNNGLDSVPITVASASTLVLTYGNKIFNVTGTTSVTAITGIYEGEKFTLIPAGIVAFSAGGTIGVSFTTVANTPVYCVVNGGKAYCH